MPRIYKVEVDQKHDLDFEKIQDTLKQELIDHLEISFDLHAISKEYEFVHRRIHPELEMESKLYQFRYDDFALIVKKDILLDLTLEYSFEEAYYSGIHRRLMQKVIKENSELISILRKIITRDMWN